MGERTGNQNGNGRKAVSARASRIERIAVFRALQLGDLLCAVPALRALRHGFPDARITLVGLPSSADFARRFRRYIDDWLEFPGVPGLPEQLARTDRLPEFFAHARARRFDLALQLHGSGERTNGVVRLLGARRFCGFSPDGNGESADHDLVRWPTEGHEITRLLRVIEHLGLEVQGLELELPIADEERRRWQRLAREHALDPHRLVLVHPGARRASRRWPIGRYAQLCDRLAASDWQVAITGTSDEQPMVASLIGAMRSPVVNLCGATGIGELGAAVGDSRLVICNDTGMSHIAAAVGTRSVVIASGSDISRWRPLNRALHPTLAVDMPCRPCDHAVCPYEGHPCANAIDVDRVFGIAQHQLQVGAALVHG